MSDTRQERPINLIQSMLNTTETNPTFVTDTRLEVFDLLQEQHARQARQKAKQAAVNTQDDGMQKLLLESSDILLVLKRFQGLISPKVRGNTGFFSSDKNFFLPADKAIYRLVELLSPNNPNGFFSTNEQTRQNAFEQCKEHIKTIQKLATNPALLDRTEHTLITVAYLITILATLAAMVAFLSITPVLSAGACIFLATMALSLLVELASLTYNFVSVEKADQTIEYLAETLPSAFGLTHGEVAPSQNEERVVRDPTLEPANQSSSSSTPTGLSFLSGMPHKSFSPPPIRTMFPAAGM